MKQTRRTVCMMMAPSHKTRRRLIQIILFRKMMQPITITILVLCLGIQFHLSQSFQFPTTRQELKLSYSRAASFPKHIQSLPGKKTLQTPSLIVAPKKINHAVSSLKAGTIALPGLDPVNTFFGSHPFAAAFIVCAIKASAADMIAQKSTVIDKVKEKSRETFVNYRRNLAFLFYGGAYQGVFQEFLFNGIFPRLFGDDVGIGTAIKKVLFDMLVISPCLCLPVAYIIKSLVFQESFQDGIRRYVSDVRTNGLLKKYWSVWFPVQCLTFTVIPVQFRITFIACFSFFWLILLSTIASKND